MVAETLRREGVFEEVGGHTVLATLQEEGTVATQFTAYTGIVREKALLREMIRVAREIVEEGVRGDGRRAGAPRPRRADAVPHLAASVPAERLPGPRDPRRRHQAHRDALPPQGGHHRPGHGVHRAGQADVGAPARGLRDHCRAAVDRQDGVRAEHRRPCRRRAAAAGPDLQPRDVQGAAGAAPDLRRGPGRLRRRCARATCSRPDWRRIIDAAGRLSEAPLFIDDTANLSVLEARAKARRIQAEHRLELVVIDYLQLMQGGGGREPPAGDLGDLALAQGARQGAQRPRRGALPALPRGGGARATRCPASRICASPAPSSRTRTSSCSSPARRRPGRRGGDVATS